MSTRVLIADDQALVRAGFRKLLESAPGVQVVGEAADGRDAVDLARRLRPGVVLMDIRMPRLDGIAATRRIAQEQPGVRVVVLTTFALDEYVYDALRAGASGFLLKDAPPGDLARAIRTVAAGEAVLAPTATRRLLDRFATQAPAPAGADVLAGLTDRERTVFDRLAAGRSNREIAAELHLSEGT